MPNPASIARGIAVATTCLLATGLAAAAPAGAATHHRGTTYLHTTHLHNVVAPATVRPGLARIHNSGKHPVLVFGKKSAAGPYELARDLGASKRGPGSFTKDFVIRDFVGAHQTIYLPLRHGTLYLVDAARLHYTGAAVRIVRVTGHKINAVVPASRPVTIAPDNSVSVASTVPYHGTLHVRNHSGGLQEVLLVGISPKTPQSKLDAFAAHPTLTKLFGLQTTSFEPLAMLSGHHGAWTTLSGARGHYAVVNFSFAGRHAPSVRMLTVV